MNQQEFTEVLKKALKASPKAYKKMSIQGMAHVRENYDFDNFKQRWVELMDRVIAEHGSWETRKGYKTWHLMEVA